MAGSNVGRAWRRFRRRPVAVQAGAGIVVIAIVVGIIVAAASGGGGKSSGGSVSAGPTTTAAQAASTSTSQPLAQVAPSTRGLTPTSIDVVFPVANLNALSDQIGFAGDPEFPAAVDVALTVRRRQHHDGPAFRFRRDRPKQLEAGNIG